jgi:hypothetical protein
VLGLIGDVLERTAVLVRLYVQPMLVMSKTRPSCTSSARS